MPINYLQKTINIYPVKSDYVQNQSNIPGATLTDALNNIYPIQSDDVVNQSLVARN